MILSAYLLTRYSLPKKSIQPDFISVWSTVLEFPESSRLEQNHMFNMFPIIKSRVCPIYGSISSACPYDFYSTLWLSNMTCFGISLAELRSYWLSCFPSSLNFTSRSSPVSSNRLPHPRRSSSVLSLPSSRQIDEYLDKKPHSQPQPPIPMEYGPSCSDYLRSVGMYNLSQYIKPTIYIAY